MTTISIKSVVGPKTTQLAEGSLINGIEFNNNIEQLEIDCSLELWDLNKKLLVIDTDSKFLHDPRVKWNGKSAPRYFLHQFLHKICKYYNIVMWTSDSLDTLMREVESLGIINNSGYKISLFLDRQSLINACEKHPAVIWKKFPDTYSAKNTVIINGDEIQCNKYKTDDKLRPLSEYLELISDSTDFRRLDHTHWEETRRMSRERAAKEYVLSLKETIKTYQVMMMNSFSTEKKLLVLDIDQTIFAMKDNVPLKRPYLDEFLIRAYKSYNIAIWSARSMDGIDIVMNWLGITQHKDYKIAFQMDGEAMVPVGTSKVLAKVKPLHVIWEKFPQYSEKNTIMIDDQRVNFLMNRTSGLKIRSFPGDDQDASEDKELLKLGDYLAMLAMMTNFQLVNHENWEDYIVTQS